MVSSLTFSLKVIKKYLQLLLLVLHLLHVLDLTFGSLLLFLFLLLVVLDSAASALAVLMNLFREIVVAFLLLVFAFSIIGRSFTTTSTPAASASTSASLTILVSFLRLWLLLYLLDGFDLLDFLIFLFDDLLDEPGSLVACAEASESCFFRGHFLQLFSGLSVHVSSSSTSISSATSVSPTSSFSSAFLLVGSASLKCFVILHLILLYEFLTLLFRQNFAEVLVRKNNQILIALCHVDLGSLYFLIVKKAASVNVFETILSFLSIMNLEVDIKFPEFLGEIIVEPISFIVFKIIHEAELILSGKNGLNVSILVNGSNYKF